MYVLGYFLFENAYLCVINSLKSAFIVDMEPARKIHVLIHAELRGHSYPRAEILEPLYADVVDLVGKEDKLTWSTFCGSGLLESLDDGRVSPCCLLPCFVPCLIYSCCSLLLLSFFSVVRGEKFDNSWDLLLAELLEYLGGTFWQGSCLVGCRGYPN